MQGDFYKLRPAMHGVRTPLLVFFAGGRIIRRAWKKLESFYQGKKE